jgi:hypothetical protein
MILHPGIRILQDAGKKLIIKHLDKIEELGDFSCTDPRKPDGMFLWNCIIWLENLQH